MLLASTVTLAPLERGALMPSVSGELLSGREAALPALAHGHVTLLAFGFSRGSSKAVQAYGDHFKAAFGADSAYGWVEVPVLGGFARIAKPMILGAMRKGTSEPDREHVMTVWNDANDWKTRLDCHDGDIACLLLLDRDGHVRWRGQGEFDQALWRDVVAAAKAAR